MMRFKSIQQVIEFFHLLFLSHFWQLVSKNLYVLKGGCNLRFFMKSIRYSEDMDLDLETIGRETLRKNVYKILKSTPFEKTLRSRGIAVNLVSAPKQTETTQRWKIHLSVEGWNLPVQTKIEFSRRKFSGNYEFRSVDPELIRQYDLYPISVNHYVEGSAAIQKVLSLAHRRETQARDLFDLFSLIQRQAHFDQGVKLNDVLQAEEKGRGITFDDYKGQVLPYLMPDYQEEYSSRTVWQEMQSKVLEFLETLK